MSIKMYCANYLFFTIFAPKVKEYKFTFIYSSGVDLRGWHLDCMDILSCFDYNAQKSLLFNSCVSFINVSIKFK